MATWLATGGSLHDVGPFYLMAVVAAGLAILGLPLGLIATFYAKKCGAPGAVLSRFISLWMLTFTLAAASWWTGRVLTDLQVFRIINKTSNTIDSIELWCEPKRAATHGKTLFRVAPGETRLWALRYDNEGSAAFRWPTGTDLIEPTTEERVFLGIGQPTKVTIHLQNDGHYTIKGEISPRWMWVDALKAKWTEKTSAE